MLIGVGVVIGAILFVRDNLKATTQDTSAADQNATFRERSLALHSNSASKRNLVHSRTTSTPQTKGTSSAQNYQELSLLSSNGNVQASLQQFANLSKCKSREAQTGLVDYYSYEPAGETDAARAQRLSALGDLTLQATKALDALDQTDEFCKGVSKSDISGRGDFLRTAALRGDPEAMVCYASSTLNKGPDYLSNDWFAYAERWKLEAVQLAQRAFEMGQPNSLPLFIDALTADDGSTLKAFQFSDLVAPDPENAYALALVYERIAPESQLVEANNLVTFLGQRLDASMKNNASAIADSLTPKFAEKTNGETIGPPCSKWDNSQ